MPPDDAARIRHMIDAAETALRLVAGRSRADLEGDVPLQLALVRAVEVIGEAAAGVSEDIRHRFPGIPWRAMIATRNRLIHAYFDIDLAFCVEDGDCGNSAALGAASSFAPELV